MLDYQCPHCKTILKIPEQFVGSTGRCRACKNSVTIELTASQTPQASTHGHGTPRPSRPPELIAVHFEVSGPSSRKDSIIELGAIKMRADGTAIDEYWNFANPEGPLTEQVTSRTGITNDMVASAPFPIEVLEEWFAWAGPNAILFSDHAHFQAKFLCATFLREDREPFDAHIIDVVNWAEQLEIRAPEYRLGPLLASIGYPDEPEHRAMARAKGVQVLASHLIGLEAGRLPRQDDSGGWNKLLGKKRDAGPDPRLYRRLRELATPLEESCGTRFRAREQYEERKRLRQSNGGNGGPASPVVLHMPEWYEEKKRALESSDPDDEVSKRPPKLRDEDREWAEALMEASKAHDPAEQRDLLMKAVKLGARDPWPYERLTGFYIKMRDYHSAQKVCQQYFEHDIWSEPRNVDSSWRLLDRMQKLERKLARAS